MKRIVLALIATFVFSLTAYASPFLTCDPPDVLEEVTGYKIEWLDAPGGTVTNTDTSPIDATKLTLWHDLTGLAKGTYHIQVSAINVWAESSPAPFSFTVADPGQPTDIQLVNEGGKVFIICAPNPNATQYKIDIDGDIYTFDAEPDGSLHYEVTGLVDGAHEITLIAINAWGDEIPSDPFLFTKQAPTAPFNLRME